jgi:hypothetical protein
MFRRSSLLVVLLAACLAVPAGGLAAKTSFKTGVSDQVPASFTSPLYTSLGMSVARYITPYDVMTLPKGNPTRAALDEWINNARSAGQDILISFEHSHTRGREKRIPNTREYVKQLKLFMHAFPFVRSISPWNEANRCQRTIGSGASAIVVGQPICHQPKTAAAYYNATVATCKQLKKACKVVALDILDQNNVRPSVAYVKSFIKAARPFPKIWGVHDYSDTNRFSTKRTKALLAATRRGEVWLTETGGIVKFGRSFPFDPQRAARALGCMFTIARSNSRIKRLYIYNFAAAQPDSEFDSGLINVDGTKRPGWDVVKARKAGPCTR